MAKGLFLPELVEKKGRSWDVREISIREAHVDLEAAQAAVPKPYTPAQKLARLHELGHVRYSPSSHANPPGLLKTVSQVMEMVGPRVDQRAVLKLTKQMEENRIDWLLWDRHEIDLRPAREVLDWAQMPDPDTLLDATGMVLQLAWTVWVSRGLGGKTPNDPPARVPDPDTGEYFDKCWGVVVRENPDLAHAIVKGCLAMYADPTHETRNQIVAELAEFFLLDEEQEEEQPPVKQEEKEAQEDAEREEQEEDDRREAEETGVGGEAVADGHVEYHDHTINIRRPTMRIVRRAVPVGAGVNTRFAHRYLLDKAIFSQRLLTEGGIMVDGSSSMSWTEADMKLLMEKMPAVTVGVYGGFGWGSSSKVIGRICTLAKGGKFSKFEKLDPGFNGGNDVDVEALRLLAKWPAPRFFLSDGGVCGGIYHGPCEHPHHHVGNVYPSYGKIMEMCNSIMRHHNILRVPDNETMHKLLRRERVTLYRTVTLGPAEKYYNGTQYPADVLPEPVVFTL